MYDFNIVNNPDVEASYLLIQFVNVVKYSVIIRDYVLKSDMCKL